MLYIVFQVDLDKSYSQVPLVIVLVWPPRYKLTDLFTRSNLISKTS